MEIELLKQANGNLPRTEEQKAVMIQEAAEYYGKFLTALGFDWQADENSADTPRRVAKAWVNDLISGCFNLPPKITNFPLNYKGMVFQGNIDVVSMCSHHNLAFTGKAHIAYLPGQRAIGLSKLNRIVDFYSRRPQIQEGLTHQIVEAISEMVPDNEGVIVMVEANHTCCSNRGIKHKSTMMTTEPTGFFEINKDGCKDEFYQFVNRLKQ